jgi:hypothetical protein
VLNVLIEVGAADRARTVIPAEQLAGLTSQRIHAAPLDPPLSVDGYVVSSLTTPDARVGTFVAAFSDQASDQDPVRPTAVRGAEVPAGGR